MTKTCYSIGGFIFVCAGSTVLIKSRFSNPGCCLVGCGVSLIINGLINDEIALPNENTNYEVCLATSHEIHQRLLKNTSLAIVSHLFPISLNFFKFSDKNKKIIGCIGTVCSSFALTQLLDTSLHLSNLKQTILQTSDSFERKLSECQEQGNGNGNGKSNFIFTFSVFVAGAVAGITIKTFVYDKFKKLH